MNGRRCWLLVPLLCKLLPPFYRRESVFANIFATSIIDEVLKFLERAYFMQTIPVEVSKEKKQA